MPRAHRRAEHALALTLAPVLSAACILAMPPARAQGLRSAQFAGALSARPAPSPVPLFAAAGEARAMEAGLTPLAPPRPEVMRTRLVSIDMPALLNLVTFNPATGAAQSIDAEVMLNLFDDAALPVTLTRVDPGVPGVAGSFVLVGKITGDAESRVFISRNADIVVVDVYQPSTPAGRPAAVYQVQPAAIPVADAAPEAGAPRQAPLSVVRQIDRSKLFPCGNGPEQLVGDLSKIGDNPEVNQRNLGDPVGPVVDVLVVYTPSAASSVGGGAEGLETQIASWVSFANNSYKSCGIRQRVRLVHTQMTNYTETASANTDLSRLAGNGDGFMDEVHPLRETYGADIVHMISNSAGICGLAFLMLNVNTGFASSAFGLSLPSCGADTFAHELGHNMGCAHDHDNGNAGAYCFSFGYRTPAPFINRTIMAYDPGIRIPYFSSPDIIYQGQAIGISGAGCPGNAANNVQTLINTAATVSAFRATVVPNPPPSAFSLINPGAGAVGVVLSPTFTWQASANVSEYGIYVSTSSDLSNPVWFRKDVAAPTAGIPDGILSNGTQYYWGVSATGLGTQTSSTPFSYTFRTRPVGDLNGDGFVGASDLGILLGSWGACAPPPSPCGADLNGDGSVNSADLALLLGAWG